MKEILTLMLLLAHAWSWCLHKTTAAAANITQIEYSPDRSLFLTTNSLGVVYLWTATNYFILTSITPASGLATDAKFSKNNTIFGIITSTSTIYVYNSSSPYALLATITGGIGTGTSQIDFSYDGDYMLICGGNSNTAKVYSFITSAFITSVSFNAAYTCKFAPNSNFAIAATTSSTLNYYLLDGTQVWSQSYNGCLDLDFDSTSATLVMSCNNGANKKAYGMDTATQTVTTIHTSSGMLRTAKITPDSSYAAYSGDEKILFIVNKTGAVYTLMYSFPLDSEAYSSDFSLDGNYLLVGTKAGYIYEYSKFCLDCSVGFYQNMTSLKCELCSEYNRACGACINSTYCIECMQGYYLEQITTAFTTQRKCLACLMEGCIVCNSSTVCLRCEVGYYVTGSNICKTCRSAIAGCVRCNSSSICEQCTHDYYLNSNSCTVCATLTGCSLCSSSAYCNVCQVGYYFNAGSCTACPTNCLACFSTTTCQDCRQGYYPTNTAGAACSSCPTPGCLSCNETGYCYECATNRYFDNTTGTCPACTYPCSQCQGSICYNCQIGYYLDYAALSFTSASQGGLCVQCVHPCSTCNSSSYCLSCPLGYYLVSATHICQACDVLQQFCSECTSSTCLNCTLGYYLNSSNQCTSCTVNMDGCLTCTSISNCLKCGPGFYLTTNTGATSCGTCTEGCQLCNSTAYCFGCIDGFYLDTGTNTCKRCVPPCSICSSASTCLECEEQYYGSGTSCLPCKNSIDNCIACDDETGVVKCSSCRNGYFSSGTTCTACTLPCLTCTSSSFCLLCEIGYFVSSNACTLCPENCTACTSATTCSSCSIGFFLNTTDSKCYHCTGLGCLTCNVSQKCLSCTPGYYLTATFTCSLCSSSIKYCETCSGSNLCSSCSFGYTLSSGNTSCTVCSSISGCFDCVSLTSCEVCENGYYWVNVGGNGACSVCPNGCLTCSNSTYCQICLPGYSFNSVGMCVLCTNSLLGCHLCTSNSTCIECQNGYYLASTSCSLCRSAIKGCQYCNSSSICTFCSYGYYLFNNTCEICSVTLRGCEVCLSSTVCKSCAVGYYLTGGTCTLCGSAMSGCISCTDNNTCSECLEGYAVNSTSIECVLCKTTMLGCIGCTNLSLCDQCQAGYYLSTTDKQCVACTQTGCEVCYETNPLLCVSCNTMYYLSSSRCYYCPDNIQGCIECTSSAICTLCQTGYFINSTNKCELCQLQLEGCAKCGDSSHCYQCKSTYFLNTTSSTCQTCLSAIQGCAYCLDLTQCISCSNGYYKNTSSGYCDLCTNIAGCLACTDSNTCILCKGDYFLEANDTLCYPCSAITGCYSCTNNLTCLVCTGGYIINDDQKCEVFTVQADQAVKGMKMISQYVSDDQLSHTLLANQMNYKPEQFSLTQWRNSTDITLQHPDFVMENLTITQVKFSKSNELLFTTNNPLRIDLNSLPARRMLYSMPEGYKTFLKMKQDMVNVILPDLYMSHSLVMDYDLSQPEFYTSIYTQKFSLFQSAIGIAIILVLTINYVIKAVVTCPNQAISEYGQILPHFSALKAPIFVIYPLFPEQISFCLGFMASEFPWARQFFAQSLSDSSETIPTQYSVLYKSLGFSSTYLLPFVLASGLLILMWLYKKNNEKQKGKSKTVQNPTDSGQYKWLFPEWPLKMVMYNFFYFGLIFNACVSLQNVMYNPLSVLSVSAVFTVLGIVCYGLAITDCLYSLYQSPLYFFKLRIFAKATLLSLSHLSPIYLFTSSLALDFLCIIIQYRFTKEFKSHPKLWLYNNFMINLALGFLVFIHSHFITLVLAGIMLLTIILIELYVHYQDYMIEKKRKRFMLPKEFKLEEQTAEIGEDLNIWNISFNKEKQGRVGETTNKKQPEDIVKPDDKVAIRHARRRRTKETALVINRKQESMESIGNIGNDNTFVAADFIN